MTFVFHFTVNKISNIKTKDHHRYSEDMLPVGAVSVLYAVVVHYSDIGMFSVSLFSVIILPQPHHPSIHVSSSQMDPYQVQCDMVHLKSPVCQSLQKYKVCNVTMKRQNMLYCIIFSHTGKGVFTSRSEFVIH